MKFFHFAVSILMFAAAWKLYRAANGIDIATRYDVFVACGYGACLYFFSRTYNAYMIEYSRISDIAFSQSLAAVISITGIYAVTLVAWNQFYAPWHFVILLLAQIVFSGLWAFAANKLYYSYTKPLKTCFVYKKKSDLRRIEEIKRFYKRFNISGMVENPTEYEPLLNELSGYEAVFTAGVDATLRNSIAKYCMENNIPGFFFPHVGDVIVAGSEHIQSFSAPVMNFRNVGAWPEFFWIKRLFDIVVSLIAIIILSPLMIGLAIAIRLYDGGPAIYKQTRLTQGGREFKILKFRSMIVDAEKDGVARLSSESDSRITPVGKFIRACRFDELPQLFNILKGDMSIVGPRPERPEITAEYEKEMPAFGLRLQVKAGLTGYAQVFGKYNTDPHDKLELDLMYINRMSILTDIQIMFATIRILFVKDSTEGIEEGKTNAGVSEDDKNE